ncbi:MAG TPA: DUF2069 domain-containing protein [Lysobacter sp.]|nr:DUF2069 domain-containing protein [Lysobacter sp.]
MSSAATPARPPFSRTLVAALIALAVLYAVWFAPARDWAALVVFALPPLALGIAAMLRSRTAAFWASVLALAWFSHGIMASWTHPSELAFGLLETLLALVVVYAANLPGLRARFSKKPPPTP